MFETIKYQLTHLGDFSGRDARQTFWYYVLFLVLVQVAAAIVISIPMLIGMFTGAMDAVQSGASEAEMEATMMAGMSGSLTQQALFAAVLSAIVTALFVASFVRRLHDAGFSGLWAIIPVATQAVAIWTSIETAELMGAAMRDLGTNPQAVAEVQAQTAIYSAIGYVGYLVVIVFGIWKSDGPNKYGEKPVAF